MHQRSGDNRRSPNRRDPQHDASSSGPPPRTPEQIARDLASQYAQEHSLLTIVDTITYRLVTQMPLDPIAAMVASLREQRGGRVAPPPRLPSESDLAEARPYLQQNAIAAVIDGWVREVLYRQPADPIEWSIGYFTTLGGGNFAPGTDQPSHARSAPSRGQQGRGRSDSVSTSATADTTAGLASGPNLNPRILIVFLLGLRPRSRPCGCCRRRSATLRRC